MDQQRQGTRSTRPTPAGGTIGLTQNTDTPEASQPAAQQESNERTHHTFLSLQDLPTGRVFTDQTGPFPVVSIQGIKAVMVMYDYDSNAILIDEGITSRGKTELLRAYTKLIARLSQAGLHPRIQRMDNEVSNIFKTFLQTQNIDLELTPAHVHRRNAAERAIRTWKNHFLSGLASLNPRFPLRYWSHLLPQSEMTLNLLRESRINPRLSAYAQLHGTYDFNKNPMAPPGCEIIAFKPPGTRPAWGFHGEKAWYTRPAMNHYRCIHAINANTGHETTVETVQFLPHNFTMPTLTAQDLATIAAHDLAKALNKLHKAPQQPHPYTDNVGTQLKELAQLFADMAKVPNAPAANIDQAQSAPVDSHARPLPRVPPIQHIPDRADLPLTNTPELAPVEGAMNPQEAFHTANVPKATIKDVTIIAASVGTTSPHTQLPDPMTQHLACAVFDPDSGKLLEYRQLIRHPKLKHVWLHAAANEFGRLAQGIRDIPGTDTITFIKASQQVPQGKKVTYGRFVADIRPQKQEKHRVRLTIGGNLIQYDGDVSAPTGGLTTYKIHCNDVISTPGARCLCLDIENYYLNTPLPDPEYMRIHISLFPEEIIQQYQLWSHVDADGYVYIRINKGMYGLPQAGILAYNLLVQRLAPYGYAPVRHTPGYWRHQTKGTAFVLVVDDFSVKYLSKHDADEFLSILRQWYSIKVDWDAQLYCGITTTWDYDKRQVTLSMPGYINNMLKEMNHPPPRRPQHAPHHAMPIHFGRAEAHLAEEPDTEAPLAPTDAIQPAQIIGKLLYYARAVDSTLSVALSALAAEQNKPTQRTKKKLLQLLDYCATHPDARLTYRASDMILHLHSDAGYNSEPGARSRAGGHFWLGNRHGHSKMHNGAILNPTHILKHVASSAADAEIGAAFINCKEAIPIRITLAEMGRPQPPTVITLDNTTAVNFINKNLKQRRTKTIDMRYYWLQDQQAQQFFKFQWDKGCHNLADYFTKHHPPNHHTHVRTQYVLMSQPPATATHGHTKGSEIGTSHFTNFAPALTTTRLMRGCADPNSIHQTYGGQTVAVDERAGPAGPARQRQTLRLLSLRS